MLPVVEIGDIMQRSVDAGSYATVLGGLVDEDASTSVLDGLADVAAEQTKIVVEPEQPRIIFAGQRNGNNLLAVRRAAGLEMPYDMKSRWRDQLDLLEEEGRSMFPPVLLPYGITRYGFTTRIILLELLIAKQNGVVSFEQDATKMTSLDESFFGITRFSIAPDKVHVFMQTMPIPVPLKQRDFKRMHQLGILPCTLQCPGVNAQKQLKHIWDVCGFSEYYHDSDGSVWRMYQQASRNAFTRSNTRNRTAQWYVTTEEPLAQPEAACPADEHEAACPADELEAACPADEPEEECPADEPCSVADARKRARY